VDEIATIVLDFNGLPPMPRNQSHVPMRTDKALMIGKTTMARLFEKELEMRLKKIENAQSILAMAKVFDRKIHGVDLYTTVLNPTMITLEGTISYQSVDWDAHKVYFDTIFRYLEIDDSQVIDSHVRRRPSPTKEWSFVSVIKIVERDF
jgi:hypothetical protein